jgi:predicted lysophospholipase L1 biosynthesis ABC-type transport system permease subunit
LLSGDEIGVWDGHIDPSSVDFMSIPGVSSVRWTHKLPFGRSGLPIGVIQTDGSASTLDAIRDRFAWSGADIHTLAQLQEQATLANDDYSSFRSGAMAITLFLLLVSAATLLVAMVDWMMERRRSLAVLSAVGVSSSTVRRSILIQVSLPLAASIVFGVVGAIVVTTLLYTAVEQPLAMASRQLVTLVGMVILGVLAITAASAPWLRITRRPDLLRET